MDAKGIASLGLGSFHRSQGSSSKNTGCGISISANRTPEQIISTHQPCRFHILCAQPHVSREL